MSQTSVKSARAAGSTLRSLADKARSPGPFRRAISCVLLLVLLGALSGCRATSASSCLHYQPATVQLTGKLVLRKAFGPPGYGETPNQDKKERYWLLKLDHPICVEGNPNDPANSTTERDVKAVQVFYPDVPGQKWMGQHVTVTGSLFHAMTGHHRTAVLIEATDTIPE